MKPAIAFFAYGEKSWIGGLYYVRNVVFSLLQNKEIMKRYNLIVFVNRDTAELFAPLKSKIKCIVNPFRDCPWSRRFELIHYLLNKVRFSFNNGGSSLFHITQIDWIPDFQHEYYPEYFSKEECGRRTQDYKKIVDTKNPLVLSSNACIEDFRKYYDTGKKKNVYLLHFVSFIEPEVRKIDKEQEERVIQDYDLDNCRTVCISNQFWKHKNHIVVFKAIRILAKRGTLDNVVFVFTGELKDYRNPEYYQELTTMMQEEEVSRHIKILGFIPREDQLALMKICEFVIQPSLFEGWGTVLEDAKVLDKKVILSDILVHQEQKNCNCRLFPPHDEVALAEIIEDTLNSADNCEYIEEGIADMHQRALVYSSSFDALLRDHEENK